MSKILLCADSFGTTDHEYPGLHFSEKIQQKVKDCEIINLSHSGGSNFLIELQLHQGLQFKPDAVILLFTNTNRITFQSHLSHYYQKKLFREYKRNKQFNHQYYWSKVKNHNTQKYLCSPQFDAYSMSNEDAFTQKAKKYFKDAVFFEQDYINDLKDYFTMINLLNLLKLNSIPFCFSLGGMSFNRPWHEDFRTRILSDNHLTDELNEHMSQSTSLNLWDYYQDTGPCFHVNDHDIQLKFADECIEKLKL